MKKLFCIFALVFLVGAADPTPKVTLTFLGSNPTFADDGTLLTAPVQAGFTSAIMSDDTKFMAQQNVTWDGADKTKSVEVDGIKLTYYQVTTFVAAIANQERIAQAAAAKVAPH